MSVDLENLEEQFLYAPYFGKEQREGWLLNCRVQQEETTASHLRLYFIDKFNNNFVLKMPVYHSFLVEGEFLCDIEEYLKRMYQSGYHSSKIIKKHDTKEFNHLVGEGKELLYVEVKYRSVFNIMIRDLKKIVRLNKNRRNIDITHDEIVKTRDPTNIKDSIIQIHEYDIDEQISALVKLNICCGNWYKISYDGETYSFEKSDLKEMPLLKIFAYDIETTKKPLQFPDVESDEIMMISIKTESRNELIINKNVYGKDIEGFTYTPKPEYKSFFYISNEEDEKSLIIRFIETIQEHKPHIISTFNGTGFDFPYLEKRAEMYDLSFNELFGFKQTQNSYFCSLITHLDCYLWVKRDSNFPKGNQGLKAVTKKKLGYVPEDIDPEDMCAIALDDPEKMALYSVSDAVATFHLTKQFVIHHIFELCSLIPYSPYDIISLSSDVLCEALLIREAKENNILIPTKPKDTGLKFDRNYAIENITHVDFGVESIRIGLYRSDFVHKFNINEFYIQNTIEKLDDILINFKNERDYEEIKQKIETDLKLSIGLVSGKGNVFYLDLNSIYPNLILTNRLQPTSIVNNDICIRCEYSDDNNNCKKKMAWNARVDYYPTTPDELEEIKEQLIQENNIKTADCDDNNKKAKLNEGYKRFEEMEIGDQTKLFKSKIIEYSKKKYNLVSTRKTEIRSTTVCQREIPFVINLVEKLKELSLNSETKRKNNQQQLENTTEKDHECYHLNSEKPSYDCILDSFYGYMLKNESRWHSLETAGVIYHLTTKIIKKIRLHIDKIGICLDFDNYGIWTMLPETFPNFYQFLSGQKLSFINCLFNFLIANDFTNYQFQEKVDGKYLVKPRNDISLSVGGPYKGIFLPATLKEDRYLRKRHIVVKDDGSIALIKGFEMVRNGEIPLVRKIQEDLIVNYGKGNSLEDCYKLLSRIAYEHLKFIYSEGKDYDDDFILEMLTDTKSIQKEIKTSTEKPSIKIMAAKRMAEVLGEDILKPKLRVDYIVSKYPDTTNIAERVVPTLIFKSERKEEFIKKWCKGAYSLKELIDWTYYKNSVERNIKRLIVLPAVEQGLINPIQEIKISKYSIKNNINYKNLDYALKKQNIVIEKAPSLQQDEMGRILDRWKSYYNLLKHKRGVLKVEQDKKSNEIIVKSVNSILLRKELYKFIYLDVPKEYCLKNKIGLQKGCFPWCSKEENIPFLKVKYSEFLNRKQDYDRLIQHIATRKAYEMEVDPFWIEVSETLEVAKDLSFLILTTFNYNNETVFVFSRNNSFEIISKFKNEACKDLDVIKWFVRNKKDILFINKRDPNVDKLKEMFCSFFIVFVEGSVIKTLSTFKELIVRQQDLHSNLMGKVRGLFDLSVYSKIPLLNLNDNLLDLMFIRELRNEKTFCDSAGALSLTSFKTEIVNSNYLKNYTIVFECVGSLILAIVQYKKIITQAKMYAGVNRRDFQALYNFVKKVLLDYSKNQRGAEGVLNKLSSWILRSSKLLSKELRDVCDLLHQRFNFNLVGNLTKLGLKIVFVSRDIFCIETDKDDLQGCNLFFDYLQEKITTYEGYEFLCLRKLHFFEKLLLLTPSNYFYVKNSEIFGFSSTKVPTSYLERFFTNELNDPHFIYDMITRCDDNVFKIIIDSLTLLKGFEHVISNCYKLLKKNEFIKSDNNFVEMLIYCRECENQNIMRDRCIKCGVFYTREEVNETISRYFTFYLDLQLADDMFCDKCHRINERVLYDICKCGGSFKKLSYKDMLIYLSSLFTNEQKKEMALKALNFYGINA